MIGLGGNLFSDWFGTDQSSADTMTFCDVNGNNCYDYTVKNSGNDIIDAITGTPNISDLTTPTNLTVKAPSSSLLDSSLTGEQIVSQNAIDSWNSGVSQTVNDIAVNSLDPSYATSPYYSALNNPTVLGVAGVGTGLLMLAGCAVGALWLYKKL